MSRRLSIFLALLAALGSLLWAVELEITITTPEDGASVVRRPIVQGTVSDPEADVWVVLHPAEVADYWVQPPVTVRKDSTWKVQIYIGRPGSLDVDKQFEIIAFANPEDTLEVGQVLGDWPEAEARSDVVEVTRR